MNRVGFDMRDPWAEVVEIVPSGELDELSRKRVRIWYSLSEKGAEALSKFAPISTSVASVCCHPLFLSKLTATFFGTS